MAKRTDKELRNPLTGQPPNSFTQATNRQLPKPTNVQEQTPLPAPDRRRLRALHREATAPGGPAGPVTGYGQTGGMADRAHAWVTGAHHMFPNEAAALNTPAINEPHEANPGVTVQRRAEDLSGPEYAKGAAGLANYGHDPRNPARSLHDVQRQTLHRVIGEHAAAGVEENASQHFYGGFPTTQLPDSHLQNVHEEGVTAAHMRFQEGVQRIASHPGFQEATAGMSHRERQSAATSMMAQSTADTSPNARWRQGADRWPNLEQAEESAVAPLENRTPEFVTGRIQNVQKASLRVGDMLHGTTDTGERFAPHGYGDPRSAAKTVAFRGALVDQDSPDAYKVSDVHEAGNMLPGPSPSKGKHYRNAEGQRVVHYPDQPSSYTRGLEVEMDKNGAKQDKGNSRAENMLAGGKGTVHALNDRATREVLAEHGLSRGVNYADNVHSAQAATWGSRQVARTDKQMADVSHASQYPVVRDWEAEGHADIHPDYRHLFPGQQGMSPNYVVNPNTSGVHNPAREAYPLINTRSRGQ